MDALKSLYDSQVSEDEAVEVLQCSQQYDEAIDLDEGAFRVVNVAPIDHEAPRRIQDSVPGELPNLLAVDLRNAFNAAPRPHGLVELVERAERRDVLFDEAFHQIHKFVVQFAVLQCELVGVRVHVLHAGGLEAVEDLRKSSASRKRAK